jgi:catecholate siderophore receptor
MSSRLSLRSDLTTESFAARTLLGAALLAGTVHGQTNAPAGSATASTNQMPTVVVTGQAPSPYVPETVSSPKYTAPIRDIPQTITVVPRATFEEQGATSLSDVLRNVPGISLQAGEGGTPAGDQMTIRGFSARTDLYVDGIRDFGGYSRDPFNLEAVEVVKGPSSATTGRGSTGGSINLSSKTPKENAFYEGSLGFGTDNFKRATLDVNQPIPSDKITGMAFRLNGLWHDADNPGRDVADQSRWGVAPSFSLGLGTPTRVTLAYFHLDQDNTPDYGIPWVAAGQTDPYLSGFVDQVAPVDDRNWYGLKGRDYEKVQTDIVTATVEHDFTPNFTLRNVTRFGRTDRDSIITAPRFQDIDPATPGNQYGTVIRRTDWKSRDQVDDIYSNQTDLRGEFDTGRFSHAVVGGLDLSREDEVNYTRVETAPAASIPGTDVYNPNPDDAYTGSIVRNGQKAQTRVDSVGLYLGDTLALSEQWQLNAGTRWDHASVEYSGLGRTDSKATWRAGIVYKPRQNGSVYFGYGTSFNPSYEGLTLSTNATSSANFTTDPETSRTFEIGTKWSVLDERLFLTAALFRTEKTNARTEDPTDNTDVTVVEGEQRVQGIELGVQGQITDDWTFNAGYTFQDSEIIDSKDLSEIGHELGNTPHHSFNLWTTYRLPYGITLGGGPRYVGSRFSNESNTRKAPDYWVLDAMAAYEVNKNTTLRLNVYNLADKDYVAAVGGGHVLPGAGRYATLTASFKF